MLREAVHAARRVDGEEERAQQHPAHRTQGPHTRAHGGDPARHLRALSARASLPRPEAAGAHLPSAGAPRPRPNTAAMGAPPAPSCRSPSPRPYQALLHAQITATLPAHHSRTFYPSCLSTPGPALPITIKYLAFGHHPPSASSTVPSRRLFTMANHAGTLTIYRALFVQQQPTTPHRVLIISS